MHGMWNVVKFYFLESSDPIDFISIFIFDKIGIYGDLFNCSFHFFKGEEYCIYITFELGLCASEREVDFQNLRILETI